MTILTLGAVVFRGFEVPDLIPHGGEQMLAVHKLPGGARKVDAMGPDDRDIAWSGRFRGNQAESRSRILDGYRKAGRPLLLTWGGYRYRVVVARYEAEYEQPFEIPYSVACLVVADEGSPIAASLPGLDQIVGSDLANALTLGGAINVASITSAISTVQTAVGAVQTLKGATGGQVQNIAARIGLAQQATLAATTQAEATLAAAGQLTPGNTPSAMIATLTAQASGFGQLSNLYQMGDTLERMGKNLA